MCLRFLNTKSFHPSTKENVRKVYIAEQKAETEKLRTQELITQRAKEEMLQEQTAIFKGTTPKSHPLNFMYTPPPGMPENTPKGAGIDHIQIKTKEQRKLEEKKNRFEWEKNAPTQGEYTKGQEVHHKPFGIEVRHQRCLKCGTWGHASTDKVCPMWGVRTDKDAQRAMDFDPLKAMPAFKPSQNMTLAGEELQLKNLSYVLDTQTNRDMSQMVFSDPEDDGDAEVEFLSTLSRKEKEKLYKLIRSKEKAKKKMKEEKSSKKRKHKHSSKDEKKSERSSSPKRSRR
eukprot:gnl/Spiro4/9181_TR4832_c0_g2_i1.p1 gnl/Spiro4/9181_TR4832_c0_g2~~gnl/Spiro4/9181_TR4832_c0_g2_i1.p1  ORF type:complete len:299 (+),score=84.85 gnl/Spiro4/9181_TR4832_c0_g2_i1:42-899(+)